jgi:uncharacterized protein YfaS (alpha-2-macroglobulin family)
MRINLISKGVLLSMMVLFIFSCQNKQQQTESNLFVPFEETPTISSEDPVTVSFTERPELFQGLTAEEKNEVIELSPKTEGRVFLVEKKEIVFQPSKALQTGQKYNVTVHLDKLFNNPDKKEVQFSIKVMPLQSDLIFDDLLLYPNNDNLKRITGKILTSAPANLSKLQKAVSAHLGSNSINIIIEPDVNARSFLFTINNIEQDKTNKKLKVSIDERVFGGSKTKHFYYNIPGSSTFTFLNYNIKKDPEPHVVIVFSDNLSTQQNLNGLIYFEDGTGIKLDINKNLVKVYPQKQLQGSHALIISGNIKNSNNKTIDKQNKLHIIFKQAAPEARFLGNGTILPGTDKWLIPFEAINLSAVDVVIFKIYSNNIKQFLQNNELGESDWNIDRVGEYIHHEKIVLQSGLDEPDNKWKSYAVDLSKMVHSEPGAIYRISLRFTKSYAILGCTKNSNEKKQKESYSYYYSNYYRPTGFSWHKKDDPCDVSYYNSNHFKEKSFLASNIGLTVKNSGNNHYQIFTRNLTTSEALSNVKVQFLSYQNQLLGEAVSDNKGEANLILDKEPFLIIAQWENQFAYLRLRGGSALSYSKFNTNGVRDNQGLKGMIFGERGVWRPGDTLFLTYVLQDKENIIPAGHPVSIEVKNARDKIVYNETSNQGINGFYVFKVPTSEDAPTGIWNARVKVGNNTFHKSLRIETILPNRLKIEMTSDEERFITGHKGTLYLYARWLHGGLASNLKADVTETIRASKTTFDNYKDYVFENPSNNFYPDEKVIFDEILDKQGKATVPVDLPNRKNLPGTLSIGFVTKVYEPGGRFSIDQKKFKYTTYNRYVGIKAPDKRSSYYYETDKTQKFDVVTVDDEGNRISVTNLKVEVYKLNWSWWYSSNNSNLANYISQHYTSKIHSETISTNNGKGSFSFELKYPEWGKYYIRVLDEDGGHSSGMILYFDWPSSYSRGDRKTPGDATLLSLSSDQKSYNVGETATISFPGSANANALVSIEKNNKVIKSWWIKTTEKESSISFEITKDMAPNVYAFISVIQPHEQTINDLPIRSYGVIPVMINDPETILTPVLTVPEKIKPESNYNIEVKEKNGHKMTYVLAIVDEGLLDLTHFKTPSLHDFFYKKEALAVKTWDLYNDVNGAFGTRLSQVFAIGGDEEIKELSKKKVNRFTPVVTFAGPFTLNEGSNGKVHHLKMSNYIGSVRIMVVAGFEGAYGKAEETVPVKQPLMVLASLPRTLVPGETLNLPVTVFSMDKNINEVLLQVTSNELFEVKTPKKNLTFNSTGEQIAFVQLKVKNTEGTGKVNLKVSSGNKSASYPVEIVIRNPNKRVYKTANYTIERGKSWKGTPQFLNDASNFKLNVSVSQMPSINLESRVQYLIKYPYGCVEQTVSSVFPQLFLSKLMTLSKDQTDQAETNINTAINRLNEFFQLSSGGFSYWPGSSYESDWGTSYAGHFLVLAKEAGYYVPSSLLNKWTGYQLKKANQWRSNNNKYYNYDLHQAYRLYTLALAGKPAYSAMNRMRETKKLSAQATLRLAAAYAIINEKTTAEKLLRQVNRQTNNDDRYWYYSYGSKTRNDALAMETYLLMGNKTKAFEILKSIAAKLGSSEWLSTQTTAVSLYAVSLFTENSNEENYKFSYKFDGNNEKVESDKPVYMFDLPPVKEKPLKVTNQSNQMLFLNIETSAIPAPGQKVYQNQGLKLKVTYHDMHGAIIDETSLPQGKDFYVKIVVKKDGSGQYENLALSAIFPSGWEILNSRMVDIGEGHQSSSTDFTDIKDDRVNLFFNLNHTSVKTFFIQLNAAYPGKYFQSPISCKAMYDNSINASVGGGIIEVTESE